MSLPLADSGVEQRGFVARVSSYEEQQVTVLDAGDARVQQVVGAQIHSSLMSSFSLGITLITSPPLVLTTMLLPTASSTSIDSVFLQRQQKTNTMLPTILPDSNGALGARDAARHTAGAKRYKYLRRLLRFKQMDFEFALWQMLYLFTSPQRVYRNFHYRKQTKDQWARDDPETLKLLLWVVFVDCIGVGLLISTLMWVISNKYLLKHPSKNFDVEWGYAFDVHLNAFYPLLVILHFLQLFFINHLVVINSDWFVGYFVGNTMWLIAIGYYVYITFLGYNALPFLKNTVVLLYPFALLGLIYVLSISLGWNFTKGLCWFYKYRVHVVYDHHASGVGSLQLHSHRNLEEKGKKLRPTLKHIVFGFCADVVSEAVYPGIGTSFKSVIDGCGQGVGVTGVEPGSSHQLLLIPLSLDHLR
ncbi:hypothetical protein FQN60_006905 [Etheostoma spectabile]|uniref:Uncharacterized protein n=1 Tax=Etheostoma spectabile TaxID=54343 RepID=A0A5J5CDD9_9PERO|nr:hypothetical protein FQN60_006905 [Etheostoma spectabile]